MLFAQNIIFIFIKNFDICVKCFESSSTPDPFKFL